MTAREHAPYHERRLEQQQLDALLRIEEILARAFPAPGHTDLMVPPEDIDTFLEGNQEGNQPPKPKGNKRK